MLVVTAHKSKTTIIIMNALLFKSLFFMLVLAVSVSATNLRASDTTTIKDDVVDESAGSTTPKDDDVDMSGGTTPRFLQSLNCGGCNLGYSWCCMFCGPPYC